MASLRFSSACRTRCVGCQRPVYEMEKVRIDEKDFHKSCLKCMECNGQLNASTAHFTLDHLLPFCRTHFLRFNSSLSEEDKEKLGIDSPVARKKTSRKKEIKRPPFDADDDQSADIDASISELLAAVKLRGRKITKTVSHSKIPPSDSTSSPKSPSKSKSSSSLTSLPLIKVVSAIVHVFDEEKDSEGVVVQLEIRPGMKVKEVKEMIYDKMIRTEELDGLRLFLQVPGGHRRLSDSRDIEKVEEFESNCVISLSPKEHRPHRHRSGRDSRKAKKQSPVDTKTPVKKESQNEESVKESETPTEPAKEETPLKEGTSPGPLLPGWKEVRREGKVYFVDTNTNVTTWSRAVASGELETGIDLAGDGNLQLDAPQPSLQRDGMKFEDEAEIPKEYLRKGCKLVWSKNLPSGGSLMLLPSKLTKEARLIFRMIQIFMGDKKGNHKNIEVCEAIILKGLSEKMIRDEIYLSLIKQTTCNPRAESMMAGWKLFCACTSCFIPFNESVTPFIYHNLSLVGALDDKIGRYARYARKKIVTASGYYSNIELPSREELIAEMETKPLQPAVFGCPLNEVMDLQSSAYPKLKIPLVVTVLADALLKCNGQKTSGIFRITPDLSKVSEIRERIETGNYRLDDLPEGADRPHIIGSALKAFFRELPESIVPPSCIPACLNAAKVAEKEEKGDAKDKKSIDMIREAFDSLPKLNLRLARYLIRFLQICADPVNSKVSLMDVSNISTISPWRWFVTEIHARIDYNSIGQSLTVTASDDCFVFVDGKLVIDFGGTSDSRTATVDYDNLGLTAGQQYSFELFSTRRLESSGSILEITSGLVIFCPWKDHCGLCRGDGQSCCTCTPPDLCISSTCEIDTGDCVDVPMTCDDGDPCTTNWCDTGQCQMIAEVCNDNSKCTTDYCLPGTGCTYTPVDCNDNNACTIDSCNETTGCNFEWVDCDDGIACTFDSCDFVYGCLHTTFSCNDQNSCTQDSCKEHTGGMDRPYGLNMSIPVGSLIIPMDNNLQNYGEPFNLRAYGAATVVLHANRWIWWAIKSEKLHDEKDFTATVRQVHPVNGTQDEVHDFFSGPFIIHPEFAQKALEVIRIFDENTTTHQVAVYNVTGRFFADIRYQIVHKPYVAVLNSGNNWPIQAAVLTTAGMVENVSWQVVSKEVAQNIDGSACFTICTEPHFDSRAYDDPTDFPVAMRNFLASGGNFLAQCHGILSYENGLGDKKVMPSVGYLLTSGGIVEDNTGGTDYTLHTPDSAYAQFHGTMDTNQGGSISDFGFAPGSYWINNGHPVLENNAPNEGIFTAVEGKLSFGKKGTSVFYLGGHEYSGGGIESINGARMYLNTIFVPADRGKVCPHLDICVGSEGACNLEYDQCCCDHIPMTCDDNNPCTQDYCLAGAGCVHAYVDCSDGDWCTYDFCNETTGICDNSQPENCDDNKFCWDDVCVAGYGCAHSIHDCDDNDVCTIDVCNEVDDRCDYTDWDCNDNNLCTIDSCNPSSGCSYQFVDCDDNNMCTTEICDNLQGCQYTNVSCDDSNECTIDSCDTATGCINQPRTCVDGNLCTLDDCLPASGCRFTNISCDDVDFCTIDSCDPAIGCKYLTVNCNDNDACTDEICNPLTGCEYSNVTCNDNDLCTEDSCDTSTGCRFLPITCNDNDACTNNTCHPLLGCQYPDISFLCDDNNACTNDSCDPDFGCTYTPLICFDNDQCTNDTCDSVLGCQFPNISSSCNDNDLCTTDTCHPLFGCTFFPIECDDNDACTNDSCDPLLGCQFDDISSSCDDNNMCTNDTCIPSTGCQYTDSSLDCDDSDMCTTDICIPATGCNYTTVTCDDSLDCTVDTCNTLTGCRFVPMICNDNNSCTVDSCLEGGGPDPCQYLNVTNCFCVNVTCDLSDLCFPQYCFPDNGSCLIDPVNCDDGNPCTNDTCSNGVCANEPLDCDDLDPCTLDSCEGGICIHTNKTCDDNNNCTTDSCDPNNGNCVFDPVDCDDGDPCTFDLCFQDLCRHSPVSCNDGNGCTDDWCDANGTCVHDPKNCTDTDLCTNDFCFQDECRHTPVVCNDGQRCTNDSCVAGVCVYDPIICNDTDPCTTDSCNPTTGNCRFVPVSCSDGNRCTDDECVGGGCVFTPVDCNDNNTCTIDSCDKNGNCHNDPVDCDDQNLCTNEGCNMTTGECWREPVICDDNDTCTEDSCNLSNGQCDFDPIICSDGNLCTQDYCDNGTCFFDPVICNDTNHCTIDSCDTQTGNCSFVNKTCDDGNLCTNDACDLVTGDCVFSPIICNDHDNCTLDSCDWDTGLCQFIPVVCDDNSLCTLDSCVNGTCIYDPIPCDDHDLCTTDSCNSTNGLCAFVPIICSDSNLCTTDVCVNGTCEFTPIICNDSNWCTEDHCNVTDGQCVFTHVICDDGNNCTIDSCVNREYNPCEFTPVECDTSDLCNPQVCEKGECVVKPVICDDGNACTNETCIDGKCPDGYRQNIEYTESATHTTSSSTTTSGGSSVCFDGDMCTLDTCNTTAGCFFPPLICIDDNPCTNDFCDPLTGCFFVPLNLTEIYGTSKCITRDCDPQIGVISFDTVCGTADEDCTCTEETGCVCIKKGILKDIPTEAAIGAGVALALILIIIGIVLLCLLLGGGTAYAVLKDNQIGSDHVNTNPLYKDPGLSVDNPIFGDDSGL